MQGAVESGTRGATPEDRRAASTRSDRAIPDFLTLRDGRLLRLDGSPPLVMGVVNVTPDSFSDGGRWLDPDLAVERALTLAAEGADILDLGAESTRPGGGVYGGGAREVPAAEELERLLPVLERLRPETDLPISIDTRKAPVARAALDAGGDLLNDVGALRDPEMAPAVAAADCPIVLMHSRGRLATMQGEISFTDVVAEVRAELAETVERAVAAGVGRHRILVDPGIGFGKTAAQNLLLLRRLGALDLGLPLLVGASRKSFIAGDSGVAPQSRLGGSLAAAAWACHHRAAVLRVHDVAETRQFVDLWRGIATAEETA